MFVMPPVFNAGDTIYFPFDTYNTAGASVTITGLAVVDIEVYKDGSVTQRASDNGYTLLDTDGIDFDGSVGLHGFSIDTSDNSDAGFWVDGAQYWVHVNAITVDGQTVRFTFDLALGFLLRPTTAGRKLDVSAGGEAGVDWANVGSPTTSNTLSGTTVGTVTTLTGHTPQTGDAFARLGAPAGASVSADILVIDNLVDDLESRLGTPSNLGSGATVAANLVDIEGQTDDIGVAGAGLSAIPIVPANVTQISGDGPAADALETMLDGTGGNILSLDQLRCDNTLGGAGIFARGSNGGAGISATGQGAAAGILSSGGATGDGIAAQGGASGGRGINAIGVGSRAGIEAAGGATGHGIQATGGATSGDGIRAEAQTAGDGMELVGAGGGVDLNADLPWTPAWDAEVQSEVTDALNAYDPPTRTEATADKDEILTQLPAAPPKNAAFTYGIKMVDSTDHATPETGLTITMTRSLDGAAFGAATGVVTEISTGHYKVVASAADMNGDVVMHRFTATGADDLTMEFKTVS